MTSMLQIQRAGEFPDANDGGIVENTCKCETALGGSRDLQEFRPKTPVPASQIRLALLQISGAKIVLHIPLDHI